MTRQWPGPSAESAAERIVLDVRSGRTTAREVADETLRVAAEAEAGVGAFALLDHDLVRWGAAAADDVAGPLRGLPVAVKDIIDTADQPTAYGSPIYAGHRPERDAAVVTRLRAAGAVPFGKTTTTEFALFAPTGTANPWDHDRTPGGSSSGSAAAVAAGSVPAALGTQTAGSVIRPASFCGVVGFKPSHGSIDPTGVKDLSPSFDTVGVLARTVPDVALVFGALAGRRPGTPNSTTDADSHGEARPASPGRGPSAVAVFRTGQWGEVEAAVRADFDAAVDRIADRSHSEVRELPWSADEHEALSRAQATLMEIEALAALSTEYYEHRAECSPQLIGYLDQAAGRTEEDLTVARATIARALESFAVSMEGFAGVITPAAHGEAPPRATTGDPWFCRAWTALGGPAISLPLLRGAHGLPVGLQLVGRRGRDGDLLALATQLAQAAG